ncbi:hypothetical protein Ciccas_009451 [Cichlidogyrus casuarinus]|uniref:Uncharacterized protein n=1 Tax=Cichlidogyrus casuarinus TaxID=1844966 RepID=A0ABD2PX07_9PLAT
MREVHEEEEQQTANQIMENIYDEIDVEWYLFFISWVVSKPMDQSAESLRGRVALLDAFEDPATLLKHYGKSITTSQSILHLIIILLGVPTARYTFAESSRLKSVIESVETDTRLCHHKRMIQWLLKMPQAEIFQYFSNLDHDTPDKVPTSE